MSEHQPRSPLEKWGAIAVAISGILTLVFLLFPDLKPHSTINGANIPSVVPPSLVAERETPAARTEPAVERQRAPDPGDVILGTWDQYTFRTQNDLTYGGTFVVSRGDPEYVMAALSQREHSGHTIGLSDVTCDGRTWTFRSNWGNGISAVFMLERVSQNVFEGVASVNGVAVQRDRWVRKSGP